MFVKGKSANPAGRPRGSLNKTTATAKEAFALAFKNIGGVEALARWARKNPGPFYKLYARLIPIEQQISGNDGGTLRFAHLTDAQLDDLIRQKLTELPDDLLKPR